MPTAGSYSSRSRSSVSGARLITRNPVLPRYQPSTPVRACVVITTRLAGSLAAAGKHGVDRLAPDDLVRDGQTEFS